MQGSGSENIRQLQTVELEILKEVLSHFEENGIRYYALGGTLLGAVRHKGFIPWDEDIDIGVPRPDYDRLLENPGKLNIHTPFNDSGYIYYISRVEDERVKVKLSATQSGTETNAWIDIFPLDGMPNSSVLRSVHKYWILFRRAMLKMSRFDQDVDMNKKGRPAVERLLIAFAKATGIQKVLNPEKQTRRLDRALKRCSYEKSDWLVNAMGAYKFREMFNKKYYGNGAQYPFEDISIEGPEDYDFVLTQLYGEYMVPLNDNHHSIEEISVEEHAGQ